MNNRMFSRSYLDEIRKARGERGFTMVEVITAVAIVIVLLAVAFVALWQYRITLAQAEVDGVAREIYVAAQNHLSLAAEQGLIKKEPDSAAGKEAENKATLGLKGTAGKYGEGGHGDDVYYLVYNGSEEGIPKSSNLYQMLPFGAIDEGVRTGGNYIVRYQPTTGRVLDVFYAKPEGQFMGYTFKDTLDECETLAKDYTDSETESGSVVSKSEDRRKYNSGNSIIGWYGGETGNPTLNLESPTVDIENGDTLKVSVTVPEANTSQFSAYRGKVLNGDSVRPEIRLIVEGVNSEAKVFFDSSDDCVVQETTPSGDRRYSVILDDVTKTNAKGSFADTHFAGFMPTSNVLVASSFWTASNWNSTPFIPGEDLKVFAWVTSDNALSNVAKTAEYTTNSLFASKDTVPYGDDFNKATYRAHVASFRHLANLANEVSGFALTAEKLKGENGEKYESALAVQDTDLLWADFKKSFTLPGDIVGKEGNQTKVYTLDGNSANEGSFYPVTPGYALTYDGGVYATDDAVAANPADAALEPQLQPQANPKKDEKLTGSHWISGVTIDDSSASAKLTTAGIFGDLTDGSIIQNLELVDTVINATGASANAGALAGSVGANGKITNVLARQNLSNGNSRVTSAGVAGGLIGSIASSVEGSTATNITGCAAAIYVTGVGDTGGLVGSAGNATILDSYSGGHTNGSGVYGDSTTESNNTRINIISTGGAAGGLAGSAAGTINYCYSTCSVSGNPAGGLVGSSTAVISNSYATGKVTGGGDKGTVVGTGTVGTDNRRLEGINPNVGASGSNADATAADVYPSLDTYKDYINSDHGANPYDATLAHAYNGKYSMQTIIELDDGLSTTLSDKLGDGKVLDANYIPSHLTTHYGDWEMPETLVVNTKQ